MGIFLVMNVVWAPTPDDFLASFSLVPSSLVLRFHPVFLITKLFHTCMAHVQCFNIGTIFHDDTMVWLPGLANKKRQDTQFSLSSRETARAFGGRTSRAAFPAQSRDTLVFCSSEIPAVALHVLSAVLRLARCLHGFSLLNTQMFAAMRWTALGVKFSDFELLP